jgi:3-demethoxyubiquinol 3-hydroxylase
MAPSRAIPQLMLTIRSVQAARRATGLRFPELFAPRLLSTSSTRHATPTDEPTAQSTGKKRKPLTDEQRAFLSSAVSSPTSETNPLSQASTDLRPPQLRVNQAGELAATRIYTAQTPPLIARHPHLRPLMAHMYAQEAGHLKTFNALLAQHRIRPSALLPLWGALSTGLGWSTALMGREAAMACTEAVETEIGEHYNNQVRGLLEVVKGWEDEGYEVGPEFRELLGTLRRIRDEELEHLDHAVEQDAKMAEPYTLLTGVIRAGCRGAIWVAGKV